MRKKVRGKYYVSIDKDTGVLVCQNTFYNFLFLMYNRWYRLKRSLIREGPGRVIHSHEVKNNRATLRYTECKIDVKDFLSTMA